MSIILNLFPKLIPLYAFIALGFLANRKLKIDRSIIAGLILYFINPCLIFLSLLTINLSSSVLFLPILCFFICTLIATTFNFVSKVHYDKQPIRQILTYAAGTGNTGYFGLGLVTAILGTSSLSLAIVANLGFILYDATVGYFFASSGNATFRSGFLKVVKLPTFQAFVIGVIFNSLGLRLDAVFSGMLDSIKGAYIVLGMMLIGIGLYGVTLKSINWKFLFTSFFVKFFIWPLLVLIFILADQNYFKLFPQISHSILLIFSIVPLPANTVVYASEQNISPEIAAVSVFISTVFCLIYIPIFLGISGVV
ncbi:AEC family transporter [Candidatus Peregrinibacteria bacterium]|nr:AEC family transporter [Candidatus Peregrinibacteria bacterium]